PIVAVDEHFVVGIAGFPAELSFGEGDVEVKRAAKHHGVVRAEGRETEGAGAFHEGDGWAHGNTFDAGTGFGVGAKTLKNLAHGAKVFRAAVVGGGAGAFGGENAGLGEVIGMDELVGVVARAEDGDVVTCANPFEENLENAETSVAHDG